MLIRSRKRTLKVKVCESLFSKCRGLMFAKKPVEDGLLFIFGSEQKWSLHMLFVFFQIDVVYLNKEKKVVGIKKKIMPFEVYIPGPKSKYIIELKDAGKIEVGEKLVFEEE
ncbi:MAG: DUF192 domain-containing protein [Candidatus Nanoarchaeia archaeon]